MRCIFDTYIVDREVFKHRREEKIKVRTERIIIVVIIIIIIIIIIRRRRRNKIAMLELTCSGMKRKQTTTKLATSNCVRVLFGE